MTRLLIPVAACFLLCAPSAMSATITETTWLQLNYCIDDGLNMTNDGQDMETIRLERHWSDGRKEYMFMTRLCGSECWEDGPWLPGSFASPQDLPAQANPDGSWFLLNAPVYSGSFTAGTGETCRGFIPAPSSGMIYVPAVISES